MSHQDDTQPKPPDGLRDTSHLDDTGQHQAVEAQPVSEENQPNEVSDTSYLDDTGQHQAVEVPLDEVSSASYLDDTGPRQTTEPYYVVPPPYVEPAENKGSGFMGTLMMLAVILMASCLCLTIIVLSGVAGIRDEMDAISTESAGTRVARVETQYALGIVDFQEGRFELAEIRFNDVQTLMPDYLDTTERLAQVQEVLAYTPTPSPTATLAPTTATQAPTPETPETLDGTTTPQTEPVASVQPTSGGSEFAVADLYGQAETAMNLGNYEDAILWLDALALADPTYRRAEAQQMLLNAHIAQGRIYLRSQNEDGEDQLARGVQLINRASELGTVPGELLYEADFVARYLAARAYVDGRAYDQARVVLTRLCEEDCDWAYRGVSVRDLLAQAGGVSP